MRCVFIASAWSFRPTSWIRILWICGAFIMSPRSLWPTLTNLRNKAFVNTGHIHCLRQFISLDFPKKTGIHHYSAIRLRSDSWQLVYYRSLFIPDVTGAPDQMKQDLQWTNMLDAQNSHVSEVRQAGKSEFSRAVQCYASAWTKCASYTSYSTLGYYVYLLL